MQTNRTRSVVLALVLGGLLLGGWWGLLTLPSGAAGMPVPAAAVGEVVINEVAWAGHADLTSDEWIELYNTTWRTISLDGWRLDASGGPHLLLHGSILPHGYYLIERSDDEATIRDIDADWAGTFDASLLNVGQALTVTDASGVVVDTANGDGGPWPAGTASGGSPPYASMERIDPYAPDSDDNWASNDGLTRNGLDADGNPINGTPICRNSAAAPAADLALTQYGPSAALPSEPITYTVRLRNAGNRPAAAVVLTDVLPAGLSFVTQSAPFSFSLPSSTTLRWEVGDLPVGASDWVVTVVANRGLTLDGQVVNVVTATTIVTETPATNNIARWTTTLLASAPRLSLALYGPPRVTAGLPLTCRVALSNTGDLTATGLVVSSTLPPGLAFLAQDSAFTLTRPGGDLLRWQVDHLPVGSLASITLTLQAAADLSGTVIHAVQAVDDGGRTAEANWQAAVSPYVRLYALEPVNYGGDGGEVAALVNLSAYTVSLGGWRLNDDPGTNGTSFPTTATVGAGDVLWLASSAGGFATRWGFDADWAVLTDSRPVAVLHGSWPGFSDAGEAAYLFDGTGTIVDVLAYGSGSAADGWRGPSVPYPYAGYGAGQVLYRKLDPASGYPVADSDRAADWAQDPDDPLDGRRLRYPGWDLEEFLFPAVTTATAPITLAVAPDGAVELVAQTLGQARESILLEGYSLESAALYSVLADRLQAGVVVTVLLEGAPAGWSATDRQTEMWIAERIAMHANGAVYFLHGDETRYAYQHAKFAVVDGQVALVSTENFGPRGMPADRKDNGTLGHRGFVVAVRSPTVVARLQAIFARDLDPLHHVDLLPYGALPFLLYDPDFVPLPEPDWTTYSAPFTAALATTATHLTVLQAPENTLHLADGLLGLLERAGPGDVVATMQLNEPYTWTVGAGEAGLNPRVQALLAAARRGTAVRLLLDEAYDDGGGNAMTCRLLNERAAAEGLALQCRLGNVSGLGLHAKVLALRIGDEFWLHLGSVNGSENSNKRNREVALQFRSPAAYERMMAVFDYDWSRSHGPYLYTRVLPLILRDVWPPAEYPLVSEVLVNPAGDDTGREWIELYNPGPSVSIAGWTLGDALTAGSYGDGRYAFPAGAQLLSRQVVVAAACATNFATMYGFNPNYEWNDCSDAVPDLLPTGAWSGFGLALGNTQDEVLLLDAAAQPVDAAAWGGAPRAGVIPYPLVVGEGFPSDATLKRYPPDGDHDDCSHDFYTSYRPSPGVVSAD